MYFSLNRISYIKVIDVKLLWLYKVKVYYKIMYVNAER